MNRKILRIFVVVGIAVSVTLLSYYATSQQYEGPPIPAHVSTSSTDFAVDMYGQIAADPDHKGKNIFFSPFGIYTAFAFLYEGAGGQTASQMQDVFGFATDEQMRHVQMSQTMMSINRNDPHTTLVTANALWLDKKFEPYLLAGYEDIVRNTYAADIDTLDFGDSTNSAKRINDWASDSTRGKVKGVIDPATVSEMTAILNNAIYFKGGWVTQFDPEETYRNSFWRQPENIVMADFMHAESSFNYAQSDGIHILQMPYYKGDRLSMLVFLPSHNVGIDGLEKMLSADMIDKWRQNMYNTPGIVIIPKFTISTHYIFNNYLGSLGMQDAFDIKMADFSGMADLEKLGYPLYVSNATQNAVVEVNEEGAEAAVVTTPVIMSDIYPGMWFEANHPFIFVIQDDDSGTILFMGRLSDPTM